MGENKMVKTEIDYFTKSYLRKAARVFGENEKAIAERAISREIARMVVEHKKKTTGIEYKPTDAMCAAVYAMEDGEGASHGVDV